MLRLRWPLTVSRVSIINKSHTSTFIFYFQLYTSEAKLSDAERRLQETVETLKSSNTKLDTANQQLQVGKFTISNSLQYS